MPVFQDDTPMTVLRGCCSKEKCLLRSKAALWLLLIFIFAIQIANAASIQIADEFNPMRAELQKIVDRTTSFDEQQANIIEYLSQQGYLQSSVIQSEQGIQIIPGKQFILDSLILRQDIIATEHIGHVFSVRLLDSVSSVYVDSLRNLGCLYSSFTIHAMRLHDSTVTIEADIIKGPSVRWADTRLEGLKRTDPDLIQRYLSIASDSTISEAAIVSVEQEASQIPFVTFVPPAQIKPRDGYEQADLSLSFVEKRSVLLNGGLGYGGTTKDELLWSLGATVDNLFGDGKSASVKSERRERKRELLEISYRQPLFLLHVDELQVRVATRDFPESFSEFLFSGQYKTRFQRRMTGSTSLTYRTVKPVAANAYQTMGVDFGAVLSRVNSYTLPTKGYRLSSSVAGLWRQYQAIADSTNQNRSYTDARVQSSFELYQPVIASVGFASTIRYYGLETSESLPPVSELFLIGGPGTLRGWNQDQFAAVRAAMFSFEPRLHFSSGYLHLFYDGGWLQNRRMIDEKIESYDDYHDGFGFGLFLLNGQKGLSLSAGWNRTTKFNDPLIGLSLSTDL
jgi:outer membrane protein assembly factor BamA